MTTHFTAEAEPHFTLELECSAHRESDEVEIIKIRLPAWLLVDVDKDGPFLQFHELYPTDRDAFQNIANAEWERVKAAQLEASRGRDEP